MKKVLSISFVFIILFLNGCSIKKILNSKTYTVFYSKISDNYYQWNDHRESRKCIRVIGVFKNNKTNQELIEKSVNSIFSHFKPVNTLSFKNESYSNREITKICNREIVLGRYGYFRNAYEKRQLLDMCIDDYMDKTFKCRVGEKVIVDKPNWEIVTTITNNCQIYHSTIRIRTHKTKDKIVLYINGKPKKYTVNYFIKVNNLLISELKKNNLKNLDKKIRF